jgi:HEAT repeat protein
MVEDEADWVRQAAVQGLRNMVRHTRHDALVVLELTRDPDQYTRSLSIGALGSIAPGISGFPEAIVRALFDEERLVCRSAVFALADFVFIPDEAASPAVDELTTALVHRDKYVRRYSAQALGGCGSAAVIAIPALVELQKDPDPHVSGTARSAIARIRNSQ